jgi:transposase InsO family protein
MFVLSVVDIFSKFIWLHPLKRATSLPIIKFLEKQIFLKYGVPFSIITDNGKQFVSSEFKKFISSYGIPKIFYTAFYAPQANTVERYNQSVNTSLAILVGRDHRLWANCLPHVQAALNSTVNLSTKFTPFYLMHGREMILDGRYHFPRDSPPNVNLTLPPSADHSQFPDMISNLPEIFDIVQEQLLENFKTNAQRYNLRRKHVQFSPGDTVWRRNFVHSNAATYFSHKLAPRFLENRVVEKISPTVYLLADMQGKPLGRFHVKDILKQ